MAEWSICDQCGDSFDFDAVWTGVSWLCETCYVEWNDNWYAEQDAEDAAELQCVMEQDREADYAWEQWQQAEREW